jgi:hypothetical protein
MSQKKRLHRISRQVDRITQGLEILAFQLKRLNQRSFIQEQIHLRSEEYPYVQEFVINPEGQLCKVVLRLEDYQRLLKESRLAGNHHQAPTPGGADDRINF